MNASTPSMVYVRRGKTTANNVRSGAPVRAGALFPHGQLQVPQKAMRQHRRQHMVVPAGICAHCIMGHPALRFAFCTAWLDRPASATEPDQGPQGRARRCMTDLVGIHRVRPHGPLDHQPDRPLGQSLLTAGHALAGKSLHHGPLGPFRALALIPAGGGQVRRHSRHGTWGVLGANAHPLRAGFPLRRLAPVRRLRALEPAARL
jgi:hypothetical protein